MTSTANVLYIGTDRSGEPWTLSPLGPRLISVMRTRVALPPIQTREQRMLERHHFKQTESPDARRVSLSGAWKADYWTHELGVSYGELILL
jgi:hypothetical protein